MDPAQLPASQPSSASDSRASLLGRYSVKLLSFSLPSRSQGEDERGVTTFGEDFGVMEFASRVSVSIGFSASLLLLLLGVTFRSEYDTNQIRVRNRRLPITKIVINASVIVIDYQYTCSIA